jgi:hypothetical protein
MALKSWNAAGRSVMSARKPQMRPQPIAYFITPHGFGHAARAAAVMSRLHDRLPQVHFHIYTTVPRWFFNTSIKAPYTYNELHSDIGLVQSTPLKEDLVETLKQLNSFYPLGKAPLDRLAHRLHQQACRLVICDIAPLGIAAAAAAGIASVLVENFTWDWIYRSYVDRFPAFGPHIAYLQRLFECADHRIQAQPACADVPNALTTSPISRSITETRRQTRQRLGIPANRPTVLVTMGGVQEDQRLDTQLESRGDITFIFPGRSEQGRPRGNVIRLPHHSAYFHPDLIQCADAVISKAGYSTTAEVYQAGTPFGYILRPGFRESAILEAFIAAHQPSVALGREEYHSGGWISQIDRMLSLGRAPYRRINGAEQAADFIMDILLAGAGSAQTPVAETGRSETGEGKRPVPPLQR